MKLYATTLLLGTFIISSLTISCKNDRVGIQLDSPSQVAGPDQVLLSKITSATASESFQFVNNSLSKVFIEKAGVLVGEYSFLYNQGVLSKIIKTEPNSSNSITWIPVYNIGNKLSSLQYTENTNSVNYTGKVELSYGAENQINTIKHTKSWVTSGSTIPVSYSSTILLSWLGPNVNKVTYSTSPNSVPFIPSLSVQVPTDGTWETSGYDSKKNAMRGVPRIWIILKGLENPTAAFGNSQNNPTGWVFTPNATLVGNPVSASYTYGNLDYPITATIGGILYTYSYQ